MTSKAEWETLSGEEKSGALFHLFLLIEVSKYDSVFTDGYVEAITARYGGHFDEIDLRNFPFLQELEGLMALKYISIDPIRRQAAVMARYLDYLGLLKELAWLDRAAKKARGKSACASK